MKKTLQKNQAFTLIELIVVIAIIVILATSGTLMLSKRFSSARDSSRKQAVSQISTALDVSMTSRTSFPTPENSTEIYDVSGALVWYQGTFGPSVADIITAIDAAPQDPSTNEYYGYSVSYDKKKYQLKAELENEDTIAYLNQAYAANNDNKIAYIDGNYNGYVLTYTGGKYYLYQLPSMFMKDIGLSAGTKIGSGTMALIDPGSKISTDVQVKVAEVTAVLNKTDDGTSKTKVAQDLGVDEDLIDKILKKAAGYDANQGRSGDSGITCAEGQKLNGGSCISACASQPNIDNADFFEGEAIEDNQVWTYGDLSGPCQWQCKTGYGKGVGDECLAIITNTWNGSAGDSDWYNAANWSEGIPAGNHDVIINNAAVNIDLNNGNINIYSLTVGNSKATTLTFSNGNADTSKFVVIGDVMFGLSATITSSGGPAGRIGIKAGGDISINKAIDLSGKGSGEGDRRDDNLIGGYGSAYGGKGGGGNGGVGGNGSKALGRGSWRVGGVGGLALGDKDTVYCGGHSFGGSSGWTAGGGAIKLEAGGTMYINADISVNGSDGVRKTNNAGMGGGAGGSIWLKADTIQGSGRLYANGGDGSRGLAIIEGGEHYDRGQGGGGAGGVITLYAKTNNHTGAKYVNKGLKGVTGPTNYATDGANGVIYQETR